MARAFSILDRKLARDLWRVKGQAGAIALVIAAGVAMMVMSHGMLISLEETMRAYYDRYRFADAFAPVTRAPSRLVDAIKEIPGVADARGRINGAAIVDMPAVRGPINARLVSLPTDAAATPINGVHLVRGRMISPERPDEALLLEPFASAHDIRLGDKLALTMNGAQYAFKIVGFALSPEFTYTIPPGELVGDDAGYAILWLGEEALEAAYDLDGAFNEVVLTFSRGADENAAIDALDRLLAPYGATGAYLRTDQISNKFLIEELAQLGTMGRVITPIFVAVSVFLLSIVMTRLVFAEREQIGLMKAFGYSNAAVGAHYLKFAAAIGVVGGVLGWLGGLYLGRTIAVVYQTYYKFPFLVFIADFQTLGSSIAISFAAAAIGAATAVRAAVGLLPAVAMRPPAPPRYTHGGPIGRLAERFLDQPTRMIFRRLTRQPLRAAATVLGVSVAMGLSVMMRFNANATNHMLEVSFNVADRSDVMASFVDPLGGEVLHDLESLDGVLYAEPYRAVSVLFTNNRRDYLGTITGLAPTPSLNRAIDENLLPIGIPGDGVVVSEQLAQILGVAVGDRLTAEAREGRRPSLDIPITGITKAMIGTPAYMNISALNRLLNEPNRIDGAYLRTAPGRDADVHDAMKEIPKIAGASLRRKSYENFRRVVDEGAGAFRSIMLVFSIVIAAGVVYNSARIAFIERAHDLASLRVLGFTKLETAYVLLGELGVLVLIALPIGSAFGYLLWAYFATALSTDLYQIPIVYKESALGYGALVILASTIGSGALILKDVSETDMASALKTRD